MSLATGAALRAEMLEQPIPDFLTGPSVHVAELKAFVRRHAAGRTPLLFTGERGLRQAQIARWLHQAGTGGQFPFHHLDVAALSPEALYEKLIGPTGLLVETSASTLFFESAERLHATFLYRLAFLLEESHQGPQPGGKRLIFADYGQRAHQNDKEQGLSSLLPVAAFHLKPLRERSEDIPALAQCLMAHVAERLGKGPHQITADTLRLLASYIWESNVDELEAVLENALGATPLPALDESLLPQRIRYACLQRIPNEGISLNELVEEYEKGLLAVALRQAHGSQTKAAGLLGLRVQTLNMKLKRFTDLKFVKGNE